MKFSNKHEINGKVRIQPYISRRRHYEHTPGRSASCITGDSSREYRTQKFMNGLQTQLLFIR